MASKCFMRTGIYGGDVGALDALDGANLFEKDSAIVITNGWVYFYSLLVGGAPTEDPPNIIIPDLNPTDKYWQLVNVAQNEPLLDDRRFFIQETEPASEDSEEGDIWIDIS